MASDKPLLSYFLQLPLEEVGDFCMTECCSVRAPGAGAPTRGWEQLPAQALGEPGKYCCFGVLGSNPRCPGKDCPKFMPSDMSQPFHLFETQVSHQLFGNHVCFRTLVFSWVHLSGCELRGDEQPRSAGQGWGTTISTHPAGLQVPPPPKPSSFALCNSRSTSLVAHIGLVPT